MARSVAMNPAGHQDGAPAFVTEPRWLTPRRIALCVLLLGTTALTLVRVDAAPGVRPTAVMLLAAWAPMALPLRRPWVRWIGITWTASIVFLHLGWWACYDLVPFRSQHLDPKHYAIHLLDSWTGARIHTVGGWIAVRLAMAFATAGLFASFRIVWRALQREVASPAGDSARQLAVIAGTWLALAGVMGTVDAFTRPDVVVEVWGEDRCAAEERPCTADLMCWPHACVAGRCESSPSRPTRKPDFCEGETSRIDKDVRPCDFCRDLTHPSLRRGAGWFAAASACCGLLFVVGAAHRLRQRARWIEQVGDGSVEGWSLAYYAPTWGTLAAIPRLVGGIEPTDLALTCLVVRRPSAQQRLDSGYRDLPAQGVVVGRLDSTPWMGGLNAARRGEDDVRLLMRAFTHAFAWAIVPMGIAVFLSLFVMGR
jgi:hypothetical protein